MTRKLDTALALYMEGIRDGDPSVIDRYSGDRYTQHSTGVPDGPEGFKAFFADFLVRCPVREIEVVRAFEDGQYVFLQVHQNINDGEAQWVTTDFFDTDQNDKLIEHWDLISAYTGPDPVGRSQIDGPTDISDLEETDNNKAVVRQLIEQTLMDGGDPARVGEFVASSCIKHSTNETSLVYSEIVLLIGQGNFVATLCRATSDGQPYAQCDIFRLEAGLIVERWDNGEVIGPEAEWVNSGKF